MLADRFRVSDSLKSAESVAAAAASPVGTVRERSVAEASAESAEIRAAEQNSADSAASEPATSAAGPVEAETDGGVALEPRPIGDSDAALWWLTAVFLVIFCVQYGLKVREQPQPLVWQRDGGPALFEVEINSATWIEWMQLKGIGPALAHRIVADRQQNGPFSDIQDLQRVDGIGPATLAAISHQLTVRPIPDSSQPLVTVPPAPPLKTSHD